MNGRFAPSPTGPLHLGNLRTALLAWLFARSAGSRFLMRIEDLDGGRSRPEHEAGQLADLAAIGLDWDGPVVRQSKRGELYAAALGKLDTYPCYCTRAEIREAASAPHGPLLPSAMGASHPQGAYPGTCRDLGAAQRAERDRSGRPPALRVRADAAQIDFGDRLLGRRSGVVDDFVVRRNDGVFAYNLAVVVDDADGGVEEVVRGQDLLDSTPRQIWLAAALGLPALSYAHVPLVLGADGERLAKRRDTPTAGRSAVTLSERNEPPERTRTMLAASLGLVAAGEQPTMAELVARFDPARLAAIPWTWSS